MSGHLTHGAKPAPPRQVHTPDLPPPVRRGAGQSYARALWRIASADVSPGNAVTLYSDGDRTFEAMLELIDGAEQTVELEAYILRDDAVGERFAAALTAAAERGALVRVLGDWIGMRGTPRAFLDRMRVRGVDVRVILGITL